MNTRYRKAVGEFRRIMKWVVLIAIVAVIGALVFAASQVELTVHVVAATVFGVFFSVVIGFGLLALAFVGERSGRDDPAPDASEPADDRKP